MKWDTRFLELCKTVASWSKDPSTKVGAVITQGKRIVSLGFNGFPAGVNDTRGRYDDRNFKYDAILHAEDNAILFAKQDLTGCTIYTWPLPPCSRCSAKIIQVGISRVVSIAPSFDQLDRWNESLRIASEIFRDVGIEVELIGGE